MSRILAKSAKAILLCTLMFLTSCAGTKHVVTTRGTEGVTLGNDEYLFPDEKGNLIAGKLDNANGKLPAGAIVILPKTKGEVVKMLEKWGVTVKNPPIIEDEKEIKK